MKDVITYPYQYKGPQVSVSVWHTKHVTLASTVQFKYKPSYCFVFGFFGFFRGEQESAHHTCKNINSLWPSDITSGSKLTQVMACCLTATSYYLNQCWLTISISKVLGHSPKSNSTMSPQETILYNEIENYTFQIITSPTGQWFKKSNKIVKSQRPPQGSFWVCNQPPSQWKARLQCNYVVSHWLSAYPEWSMPPWRPGSHVRLGQITSSPYVFYKISNTDNFVPHHPMQSYIIANLAHWHYTPWNCISNKAACHQWVHIPC